MRARGHDCTERTTLSHLARAIEEVAAKADVSTTVAPTQPNASASPTAANSADESLEPTNPRNAVESQIQGVSEALTVTCRAKLMFMALLDLRAH